MQPLEETLQQDLDSIQQQSLLRQLRRVDSPQGPRILCDGRELVSFSSNDYLGLANHAALKRAAIAAVEKYGTGSGASRLISGSLAPHHELEDALAAFKRTEAALTFSSGYAAALGTIGALLGKDDTIVMDRLVHACVIDAARLSGAKMRVFKHNDPDDLERVLHGAIARRGACRTREGARGSQILIVTESVFSMDGDQAPLTAIVHLKEKYGAWLMLDEAHATGVLGPRRAGLAEALVLNDRIEVQMGTLGKAMGSSGGYICGSRRLIDLLINRARSFIFSTAPVPAAAAAASAAVGLVQGGVGAEKCRLLWERIGQFSSLVHTPTWSLPDKLASAIAPIRIGDERQAVEIASHLREHGFHIPAVRYPAVPRGEARLRLTLTAGHTGSEVADAVAVLAKFVSEERRTESGCASSESFGTHA